MVERISTPFAENGDQESIPDASIGTELSMDLGWSIAYDLAPTVPGYRTISRPQHNKLWNIVTANIKEWQDQTYPEWNILIDYSIGSRVFNGGMPYEKSKDNDGIGSEPGMSADWIAVNDNLIEERLLGPGAKIYRGSNGQYVQNGDVVPSENPPYTHLAVPINGKAEDVVMSPVSTGVISGLTELGATIGGNSVSFNYSRSKQFSSLSSAINSPYISNLDVVTVKERTTGNGGRGTWDVVLTSSVIPDGYGVVQSIAVPTLSFVLRTEQTFFSKQFGASPDNSNAQNKAVIQHMIDLLDGNAGNIYIEPDISYGYVRGDKNTWPDFSVLSANPATRIIIDDYSFGKTEDPEAPPSRSGSQHRKWYFTGNQNDGQHNGNFEYVKSGWHPGYFISNDGDRAEMAAGAGINRRASTIYGTEGVANWRVGQGRVTGDFTEDELAQFIISANGLSDLGLSGLTTMHVINKSDARMGWNTGTPRYAFDFISRIGQPSSNVLGFQSAENEPVLLLQGETGTVRISGKANSGFSINDATSALIDVTANGGVHSLRRNTAGNVSLNLQSFSTQRKITVNDADSELRITNAAGVSNTLRHTDAGNLTITGSYSPFTGTHLFFCPDKLEEGYAVELVDGNPIDYIEYIAQEPDCIEHIEHIEAIKPMRLKGELDEEYNERCTPAYDRVVVETVEKDPVEKVTQLNGTVALCNTPESKICAGIVEHQVEMEGGYLTYVAAVGDNKTEKLKGFRVNGDVNPGDILCTDIGGKLKVAQDNISRSVVIFKAMSPADSQGRCYGYFLG